MTLHSSLKMTRSFPYASLLPGKTGDTLGQSRKSLCPSQQRGRRGRVLLRGCLCAKSCPAWQRPCPRAMLAAEVSQHSSPSLSELDRKLGAAPNGTDGEVTLEIPLSSGAIPRQDPMTSKEHAGLGWGTRCSRNTQLAPRGCVRGPRASRQHQVTRTQT